MSDSVLNLVDLGVRFTGGGTDAVTDLNLTLDRGRTLALVGASGCGKTAVARAITGLHPPGTTIRGRVLWNGVDLLRLEPNILRRRLGSEIASVFQDAGASLNPVVKVGDQLVELIRLHRGLDRAAAGPIRDALFAEVRLEQRFVHRYPHQLSGGEQQRVALAMALSGDPALLIADEPTTALDPVVQQEIVALLQSLVDRRSLTLLFITHDLGLAGRVATDVAVMDQGRLVEHGCLQDVVAAPRSAAASALIAAYREAPASPQRPLEMNGEALVVEGLVTRYHGADRPALAGLSFRLTGGEAFGLVGASGSGKTTLARVLAGFMDSEGTLVPSPCGKGGASPIQMIFQNPAAALDPRRSVGRSVRDAAVASGIDDPDGRARSLLDDVGFPLELSDRRPHALSGGQRQRVVIARALAAGPRVIVADEPASSLDLPARLALVDLLDRMRTVYGITLLLISHDLRLVRRCCGRIGVLDAGALQEIVMKGEIPTSVVGRQLWSTDHLFPFRPGEDA